MMDVSDREHERLAVFAGPIVVKSRRPLVAFCHPPLLST
jgi:hypothetical protein